MAKQSKPGNEFIWEQLDGESPEAYEAYALYRDMAYDEENHRITRKRSLSAVAQRLGKSTTLMSRWSSKYKWVDRVTEYDRYVESIALIKATNNRAKVRARQIKLGASLQEIGFVALKNLADSGNLTDPKAIIQIINIGATIEDKQTAAEVTAHQPTKQESEESEALKKLDEVLGEIKSGF